MISIAFITFSRHASNNAGAIFKLSKQLSVQSQSSFMPYFPLLINADILTVVHPNPIARLKVGSMRSSQASWPGRSWVVGCQKNKQRHQTCFRLLQRMVKMLWVHTNVREACFGEGKGLGQMVLQHLHHIYISSLLEVPVGEVVVLHLVQERFSVWVDQKNSWSGL